MKRQEVDYLNQNSEEEALNRLRRAYNNIEPREEFTSELEDKLVARFSKKKKVFWYPIMGLIVTTGLFLILILNWEESNQNTSQLSQLSQPDQSDKGPISEAQEDNQVGLEEYSVDVVIEELKVLLEMDNALIPTTFPIDDNNFLTGAITENKSSSYEISFYQTEELVAINDPQLNLLTDNVLASFSATKYRDSETAINTFNEIDAELNIITTDEAEADLGYGIFGVIGVSSDSLLVKWQEGNWELQVSSVIADQMDNVNIATQMVEFLERKLLPAPEKGRVIVEYAEGGNAVDVQIFWVKESIVYQLDTEEVPINALDMAVSVQ